MNKDKYVFAQMVEFLDNYKFLRIVKKYVGNKYVKHFTCWNQLLTLMFGQLCNHESLRDLIVALNVTIRKIFRFGYPEHIFSFFTGYIRYGTSDSYFDTFYLIE